VLLCGGGVAGRGVQAVQEQRQVDRAIGDPGGGLRGFRRSDGPLRVAGVVGEPVQDAEVHQVGGGDRDLE